MNDNIDKDLYRAAYDGNEDLVEEYITRGADVNWVENKGRWTALHRAAWRGDLHIVRRLVRAGAQLEARSNKGHTPLLTAAFHGRLNVVRYLLLKGAEIDKKMLPMKLLCSGPLRKVIQKLYVICFDAVQTEKSRIETNRLQLMCQQMKT